MSVRVGFGSLEPTVSSLPAPRSKDFVDRLARSESPAFTARRTRRENESGAAQDPIVWKRAHGSNVEDVDGNIYVDFSSGFGVAAIGHSHLAVQAAITEQSTRLIHALGDLHPSDRKVELLERLCDLAPWDEARAVLSLSGSEAVEVALKTAALHSQKPGVLAFDGGYHGLAYGPLSACGYSKSFRDPFAAQLNPAVYLHPFGADPGPLPADVGAILVEPIQGRGGVHQAPPSFLQALRKRADDAGALLIVDEIFTGLGRCGQTFVSGDQADLLCIGKALGGGAPISACLGKSSVMDAWAGDGVGGEAIHTGTFYGNPLGCAAALATLDVLRQEALAERALEVGARFQAALSPLGEVRGVGLMIGLVPNSSTPRSNVLGLVRRLLERGFITLPAGMHAEVLQLVPPLNIPEALLHSFVATLSEALSE
ncbi:MAG: 4-aminobutyrate aminotransferase/(S)-3-amino-2-methylpropionate transaminase [Polyangiales bacterium]